MLKKCLKTMTRVLPDSLYIRLRYFQRMKKFPNLKTPKTFNEKLQWLKLHDRKPEYTKMVDKYEVRAYIAEKIGEEYLIPLLGVWGSFDNIDFEKLPEQFVLKCTHDSGGLVICRDKNKLDIKAAREKINKAFETNYYWQGREWPYKNVRPRIVAEKYMEDKITSQERGLTDYKIYCFEGKAKFAYVSEGLENHTTANINFVTLDWKKAPFQRLDFKEFDRLPKRPRTFDKMVELAEKLAKGIHFLRVDFYEIDDRIYFGELTFFPGNGCVELKPAEWDRKLGEYISL